MMEKMSWVVWDILLLLYSILFIISYPILSNNQQQPNYLYLINYDYYDEFI